MSNIDIKSLEKLLEDFYNLTGIKACIYDLEGNELCYYPSKFSRFCEIVRRDKHMDTKCKDCDKLAFDICRKTHCQYSYTCHAGLWECVSPILYNGNVIGFIMLGQIKTDSSSDFDEISDNLPEGLKEKLKASYENLPVISSKSLSSAFHILDACAGYELLKRVVQLHNTAIDTAIRGYIANNLSGVLSVSSILSEFHLSHGELYRIFKEYFNSTPAEYIKKERLNFACRMLLDGSLRVNEIASLCGIPDYNYFSKQFKAYFGCSPREYKKKNQK